MQSRRHRPRIRPPCSSAAELNNPRPEAPSFRSAYLRVNLGTGILVSAAIGLMLPVLPRVIGEVFPREYIEPVSRVSRILAVGYMATSFTVASDAFYLATDTLKVALRLTLIALLPYVCMMVWLVREHAELGVLWGLSLSMTFSLIHPAFALAWFARKAASRQ